MDAIIESKWLCSAIRYTLLATFYTSALDGPGPPQQRDLRFRKLMEGIYYSMGLILTYHLVIFGLAVFTASLQRLERVRTWKRGRRLQLQHLREDVAYDGNATNKVLQNAGDNPVDLEGGSSSGSSTVKALPMQIKDFDEEAPLLHNGSALWLLHPRRSLMKSIEALIIYQPPPIPVVNKVLPSNAYTIVTIGFVALNNFYTFFHIDFIIFELFVFANRCGLVFAANLSPLYLLAAKTQPLRLLTRYSYESLNIIHRRLGDILCLEALLHSIDMAVMWYALLRPIGFTLTRFLLDKVISLGIASFISYETLYFTSLASFCQRWYELFLELHVILQATALVLLFFHHPNSRVYVGIALGIFLFDILIYRVRIKSATFAAIAEIMEDSETVRISANFRLQPSNTIHRLLGETLPEAGKLRTMFSCLSHLWDGSTCFELIRSLSYRQHQ